MENALYQSMEELKLLFPNQWILLGDPNIVDTEVLGGVVICHHENKATVYAMGKNAAASFSSTTIVFTGTFPQRRKSGLMRRLTP